MKLFEFINKCLNAYGCKKAFGVPGSLVMPIWQGLTDLELSLCGHEQEASYCASGYAKMSLEPVAVITTGSPGVTNCISGIAGGYMDSVPLIYISGRTATFDAGNGLRQEESRNNRCFDSIDIMQSITKKSILIKSSETAAKDFEDICTLALKVRKGPVHITIPENIQNEEIGYVNIEELYKRAEKFKDHINANEIIRQDFTSVINNSKRKLIIMGWGCWLSQSIEDVYELAKRINAPILVTAKAFCCASENSMLLGKLGYGENPIMKEFLKKYKPELVLAFGTSMSKKDISDDIRELLPINNTHIFTIEPEDSNLVNTIKLDSIVGSDNVTFIKLDVEGAEKEALIGAEQCIKNNKPKLAISVYHNPDDFLEITDYLSNLVPDYKFVLRHYHSDCIETILYAYTEEGYYE